MADTLAPDWLVSLGEYMQEESEKQWFWFSAFVVAMLVGALWLQASLVLPGVSTSGLLDEGETLESVEWDSEGESALILVARADANPVRLLSGGTLSNVDSSVLEPTAICSSGSGWLVGGRDGKVASYNSAVLTEISLDWGDVTIADIVDIACIDEGSGWLLSGGGRQTQLHTFHAGSISPGTSSPTSTTVMTSVHQSPDGSTVVVTGYDTALATPTLGLQGEVVIRAEGVLGQQPNLVTLHHGAGGPIHTVAFVDHSMWDGEVTALLAGPSSTLLLKTDSTIVDLPHVTGSTAAAVDSSGIFWFARGDSTELVSYSFDSGVATMHSLSSSSVVDAEVGASVGDDVVFYGTGLDGDIGSMNLDPSAESDVGRSLARMGDLAFLLIAVFAVSIIAHSVWVKGLSPW